MKTLMWFRQDLRILDNPALHAAMEQGEVLALYIVDTHHGEDSRLGEASNWWLHHSLCALNQQLDNRLLCLQGNPETLLPKLIEQYGIECVHWNRVYQPWQIYRDTHLKQVLTEQGTEVKSFNASLLWEPWQVLKKDGMPYKVFTPYYRRGCLSNSSPRLPISRPPKLNLIAPDGGGEESIDNLTLLPNIPWYEHFDKHWTPGEAGAADKLQGFVQQAMQTYKEARDIPEHAQGTSHLSPHLRFGEISPHQVWFAALAQHHGSMEESNLDCFLSELGWREFSYYLLYHFPHIPEQNFNPKFNHFPWQNKKSHLQAWQQGNTGIPIVDAGMRELWKTGYMHNRVRMIVGSFLVKNLLIDWRKGAEWFWDCLLDADLASNSASWQWVAGSGADAAPYFRVFNPVLQGQKFDKGGHYVRRYCPELAALPDKYVHCPWEATPSVLEEAGVTLGVEYPQPIADLKASRLRALDAFSIIKNKL